VKLHGSGQRLVADWCEHGTEPTGILNVLDFFVTLKTSSCLELITSETASCMAVCTERHTVKKNWIEFELDYHLYRRVPMQNCNIFLRLLCSLHPSPNINLFNRQNPSSFVLWAYPVPEWAILKLLWNWGWVSHFRIFQILGKSILGQ
jgi:hypothetical protein